MKRRFCFGPWQVTSSDRPVLHSAVVWKEKAISRFFGLSLVFNFRLPFQFELIDFKFPLLGGAVCNTSETHASFQSDSKFPAFISQVSTFSKCFASSTNPSHVANFPLQSKAQCAV